jgi:lipopolysaccharide/colanic/teichoic acid biosynthesis glycosyltransferase
MTTLKRAIDVVLSVTALLVSAPLLAVVGLVVWSYDGGPVLFRQERVGLGGRPFTLLKIRSMRIGSDKQGALVTSAGDERVTPVGRWLRKLKIDEWPQFWNVLRGEMTLVGPRPEVARYVSLYSTEQRKVLALTPGLTDPATVEFRNEEELLAVEAEPERFYIEVVMPRKIEMNLRYAETATTLTDLGVLLRTGAALFRLR